MKRLCLCFAPVQSVVISFDRPGWIQFFENKGKGDKGGQVVEC
uniref:Uncharacterized protein n=1 Tax=Anopheles quadriannulatus TaxID=34691 RepID=A0A182XU00_ANOQN